MDLETSNPQRRGPFALLLVGGSSGALGFVVATGVGSAPLELLLAVFVSVLAVSILSQYVDSSGRLIGETIPGILAGVAIETLAVSIIFSIATGALAAFLISSLRSRASLSGFTLMNSNAMPRVVLALLAAGLLPVYLFGRYRGIPVDALIAYAFITSPIWVMALLRYLTFVSFDKNGRLTSSMRRPRMSRDDVATTLSDPPQPTAFHLASIRTLCGFIDEPGARWCSIQAGAAISLTASASTGPRR